MEQEPTRLVLTSRSMLASIFAGLIALLMMQTAFALPDAGSVIGNQATATYTDASGEARSATSNLVETLVDQVAGVDLTDDQTKSVAIGGTVYFPHTVTNTGNGLDTYDLTAFDEVGADTFDFTGIVLYADADGDGIPDSFTPITATPELEAGQSYSFVVGATVPSTVTNVDTANLVITADSQFDVSDADPDSTDTNVDTAVVTNDAVIDVTKAISQAAGPSPNPGPITITLTYTNTGNDTATDVTLVDDLNATGGMTYSGPDSGRWSGLNGVSLTDDSLDGFQGGIDYSVTGNVVTAIIASVPPGESGTLKFDVSIDGGLAPGNLDNIATYSFDPDGAGVAVQTTAAPTNTATYTVAQTVGVTAIDTGSVNDEGAPNDDVVDVNTAVAQGATVPFENRIINNGNGVDTFEITVDPDNNDTFPVGTTFQIFQADATTGEPTAPLTDTNGDGNPDTGPLDPAEIFDLVIVAVLPPGASGTNGILGFNVVTLATSTVDSSVSDPVTNHLREITANTVDLTNADGTGTGPGLEPDPVNVPVSTNPNTTVNLPLTINNTDTNGVSDEFELSATLPNGWTVIFIDPLTGAEVTSTGSIAPGGSANITAQVTVPPGYPASALVPEDVIFTVVSPTTGATDTLHDGITVNAVHDIGLTPDNTGQVFPGGSIVYAHTLINNGNIDETSGVIAAADTSVADGWTSVIYLDANENGVLDSTDPVIDNINDLDGGGLAQGESEKLFVKVFAPAGAVPGENNSTVITASADDGNPANIFATDSATDGTVVITGDVELLKKQALDANCDGVVDTSFSITTIGLGDGAIPGACIAYQITASNSGSDPISALVINDSTPNFTTYFDGCATACAAALDANPANASAPASGSSGVVAGTVGVMNPASSSVLTFTVKIDE